MSFDAFTEALVTHAEHMDRKLTPARIAQLKQSYDFFRGAGLTDEEIKASLALTRHEMRLIRPLA